MAHLNVRERKLEAKIVYVGAALSGRATNFEKLGGGQVGGDTLSLHWAPKSDVFFRDCKVGVQLVTSCGDASGEEITKLLRDADGVVFVADADPDATTRNQTSLGRMREALAARTDRRIPVVVQINKTDLLDAVDADRMNALLELDAWPKVQACALHGDGVVETVERSLAAILADLGSSSSPSTEEDAEGAPRLSNHAPSSPQRPGNPLLSALRQVLRETVTTEVELLDEKLSTRLAEHFSAAASAYANQARHETTEILDAAHDDRLAMSAFVQQLADEMRSLRSQIDAIRETATLAQASAAEGQVAISEAVRAITEELSSQRSQLTAQLTALEGRSEAIDAQTTHTKSVASGLETSVERMEMSISVLRGSIETLAKTSEKANQQTLATSTSIKRGIDVLSSDLKAFDVSHLLTPIKASLDAVVLQMASFAHVSKPLSAIAPRLAEIEPRLQALEANHTESRAEIASSRSKVDETLSLVQMLIEELKKPKKSWFT